jgi:hypothetical protein
MSSHRWNCIQCLLRGEQQYAMPTARLQTARKICCAFGRCMRSSWYVYHQPMKMAACQIQFTVISIFPFLYSVSWATVIPCDSSNGPVKGELPACCIFSPKSATIFTHFEQPFLHWCISGTANKMQWSCEAAYTYTTAHIQRAGRCVCENEQKAQLIASSPGAALLRSINKKE